MDGWMDAIAPGRCYDSLLLRLMCVDAAVKKSVSMERQEEILSKHIAIGEAQ